MPKTTTKMPSNTAEMKLKRLDTELDRHFKYLNDGKPSTVWYINEDPDHPMNEFAMEPKRFNILCSVPGIGKTSFVHSLVFDAMRLNSDLTVLEINCDTPFETIIDRELSRQTGIPCDSIRLKGFDENETGFTEEQTNNLIVAKEAIEEIANRYFFLGSDATFPDAISVIEKYQPNIFIVDYVQIMNLENNLSGMEKMVSFCRQCKALKDKYDLCIIGIAAATKDSFDKQITLSSVRDSSELAYIPDDCIVINRSQEYENVLEFTFEKRRNGDKTKKVYFKFDGKCQTFSLPDDDSYQAYDKETVEHDMISQIDERLFIVNHSEDFDDE